MLEEGKEDIRKRASSAIREVVILPKEHPLLERFTWAYCYQRTWVPASEFRTEGDDFVRIEGAVTPEEHKSAYHGPLYALRAAMQMLRWPQPTQEYMEGFGAGFRTPLTEKFHAELKEVSQRVFSLENTLERFVIDVDEQSKQLSITQVELRPYVEKAILAYWRDSISDMWYFSLP